MKSAAKIALVLVAMATSFAQTVPPKETSTTPAPTKIIGYVRDSGCVHRYHEVVKPLPNGCVEACVRGGSPLVILTKSEQVYHPISAEMPDVDVRQKLLPFVGKLVEISGHIYSRGGSDAISLEQIQEVENGPLSKR
jgi:hypothetical protein